MFKRKKRAPETDQPAVVGNAVALDDGQGLDITDPEAPCEICGAPSVAMFVEQKAPPRCPRHSGAVFTSHAISDAPETRGA